MAISSINIANGHAGFLAHNDRSQKTVNSIFPHNKNEIFNEKKKAFELYRFELAARSEAYSKRTGQRLQKNTTSHLSSIVNLNAHHNLDDVKKVAQMLEQELGTKVFQIAVHRDEGHVTKTEIPFEENLTIDHEEENVNYHAHIEFMGLDAEGRSIRQKLKKKMLSSLQDAVADILEMERGTNYIKEKKPRPKRLGTYEYKAHKQRISAEVKPLKKEIENLREYVSELQWEEDITFSRAQIESQQARAKIKDLKAEIKELREELQSRGAEREAYAQLEQLNRELKQRIKSKDLTIGELQNELGTLKNDLDVQIRKNQEKDAQIANMEQEIANLEAKPNADEVMKLFDALEANKDKLDADFVDKKAKFNYDLSEDMPIEQSKYGTAVACYYRVSRIFDDVKRISIALEDAISRMMQKLDREPKLEQEQGLDEDESYDNYQAPSW